MLIQDRGRTSERSPGAVQPSLSLPLRRILVTLALALTLRPALHATTYAAISDAELTRRSPIVVLAEALEERTRTEWVGGEEYPFTVVALRRLEVLKGTLPEETFQVRLPGGWVGDVSWWVPGVPRFDTQQRALLFLAPLAGHPGEYRLTELALSKFDVMVDARKSRFAVRSIFQSGEERLLSADASQEVAPREMRDFDLFLEALRAAGRGEPMPPTVYREPVGALRPFDPFGLRPLWVNIGGREPGGGCESGAGIPIECLFRWFWDTGASPDGIVRVIGTQLRLSDGSDGVSHVAASIAAWTSIPGTNVRYGGPSETGNVTVNLGVVNDPGGAWTTAYDCSGGTLGVGGPRNASGPRSFRGDSTFYATRGGNVTIRQWDCGVGTMHPVNNYRAVVVHELGHTLGLGHPDQAQSTHSTTTEQDWNNAIMRSTVRSSINVPQLDDIEAMLYYYGTGVAAAPLADFRFTPADADAGAPVTFTDISTNAPTGWTWSFGDGAMSSDRNPTHAFAATGTYAVTLTARNATGSHTVSRVVTIGRGRASCDAASFRLCFNTARFAVTLGARDQRTDRLGAGQAIPQNDLFGYFSIPGLTNDAANPEVFVKVLDGRAINGSFWVFYGGLTDLEYTITVLDLVTGQSRSYTKAPGDSCGGFDTSAFPAPAADGPSTAASALPAGSPAFPLAVVPATAQACPPSPGALCLNSANSFEITLSARDQRTGSTGPGLAIPQNDLFGYFSIPALTSNPANPEVFVKVINGTSINARYWVFYGGLTDLEYTITVRESDTGRIRTYTKPAGSACGGFDTEAF